MDNNIFLHYNIGDQIVFATPRDEVMVGVIKNIDSDKIVINYGNEKIIINFGEESGFLFFTDDDGFEKYVDECINKARCKFNQMSKEEVDDYNYRVRKSKHFYPQLDDFNVLDVLTQIDSLNYTQKDKLLPLFNEKFLALYGF